MKRLQIFGVVFILSLAGVIIFQEYQISGLISSDQKSDNRTTKLEISLSQLNASYQQLLSRIAELETSVSELNATIKELLLSYFFFQDPEFLSGLGSPEIKWEGSSWNFTSNFAGYFDIQGGFATLSYNESSGNEWGGTVLVQGKLPHSWGSYLWPLEGRTRTDAKPVEYVKFERKHPIREGKFLLKARVMVTERNYTVFGTQPESVSNVGVDLMFGFDNANYDDKNQSHCVAIHADVILSRAYWDKQTKDLHHNVPPETHDSGSQYDGDYHLTLIRGQITQLTTWYTFEIDLTEILNTIFSLTNKETIRYYGAQVYTDGIGSHTTAIFDYLETTVDE